MERALRKKENLRRKKRRGEKGGAGNRKGERKRGKDRERVRWGEKEEKKSTSDKVGNTGNCRTQNEKGRQADF